MGQKEDRPVCSACTKGDHENCAAGGLCYCPNKHHDFGSGLVPGQLGMLEDFGLEPNYKMRGVMRAMLPVKGVKLQVTKAERAKRREGGYMTDDFQHGTLMLDEFTHDPKYWESEGKLPPVDTYKPKKRKVKP